MFNCHFNNPYCSCFNPCARCNRLMDLELKKKEIEVETRYLESSALEERARAAARARANEALSRAIVDNPKTALGIGLGLLGVFGASAYIDRKKSGNRSQNKQFKKSKK